MGLLHQARFREDVYATPALVDGRIYLRTGRLPVLLRQQAVGRGRVRTAVALGLVVLTVDRANLGEKVVAGQEGRQPVSGVFSDPKHEMPRCLELPAN